MQPHDQLIFGDDGDEQETTLQASRFPVESTGLNLP